MLTSIISHSKKTDSTTTVEFGKNRLNKNVQLDLNDTRDAIILNSSNVYDYLSGVRTPFLLGYPTLILPKTDELITETTVFQMSAPSPSVDFKGTINQADWQIARDKNFTQILVNLRVNKVDCPGGNIALWKPDGFDHPTGYYWVRAKYIAYPHASNWTIPVRVKFPSMSVRIPTITVNENGLTPNITVSPYTLTQDAINQGENDQIDRVEWGVNIVPKYTTIRSTYVNRLLGEHYRPTYKYVVRNNSGSPLYSLVTPFTDSDTGERFRFKSGLTYLITCTLIGKKFTSMISRYIVEMPVYKIKEPTFIIKRDPEDLKTILEPMVIVDELKVTRGSDSLKHIVLDVYKETGSGDVLAYNHTMTSYVHHIPPNVLEPSTTYFFNVIIVGESYGPSDPKTLTYTTPTIGIMPPTLSITTNGLEQVCTLSPFATFNGIDTMRGTQWVLHDHANRPDSTFIKEWIKEDTDTFLKIPKSLLQPNTNYRLRVRYLGHKHNSPWVEQVFKTIEIIVYKPVIKASTDGLIILANISDFVVVGEDDTPKIVQYNVAKLRYDNSDPLNPAWVHDKWLVENYDVPWSTRHLKLTVDNGVEPTTRYRITGKIIGTVYSTPMSDPIDVQTIHVVIPKPVVTITAEPNNVPRFPLIESNDFAIHGIQDTHASTSYEIYIDGNSTPIWTNHDDATNKYKYRLLDEVLEQDTKYILRVRYNSSKYGSSPWTEVKFRTRIVFIEMPDDGLPDVIIGDITTNDGTKYYGAIDGSKLNDTRHYLGNWNNTTEYPYDSQVKFKEELWYALDTSQLPDASAHLNKNRIPGEPGVNGVEYWKKDTRETLPTSRWLLNQIGIKPGQIDNNESGITTGNIKCGEDISTHSPGIQKFMIDSKILYVYQHINVEDISYNDLAMAGIVGKGRTIRIGSRLYWIRILTEREHTEIATMYAANSNVLYTDIDQKKVWVDSPIGSDKQMAKYSNPAGGFLEGDGRKRSKDLRLVLEYISQYKEPWMFAKKIYPTLQYDRITDTGFIGKVPKNNYEIRNKIGLITGTVINDDTGYLAYYSHGKRLLVNRMPIAYGVGFDTLKNLNVVYGAEVKLPDYNPVVIKDFHNDGLTYNVRLLRGGPRYIKPGPIGTLPPTTFQAYKNVFELSEWNELIYRVAEQHPKDIDANPLHGGFQIGSNWNTMDYINVGVYEHFSGNGCHDYVLTFANDGDVCSRGGTRLEAVYYTNKETARNDHGVRLVLEDTTDFTKGK